MNMEQKVKLILKGILFYVTFLVSLLSAMAVDSIYDNGYFFEAIILVSGLIYTCYKIITPEEFEKITFSKFFNNWF